MDPIENIFDALGGTTVIATKMRLPMQTVSSWKSNGQIPPWRRPAVLKLPVLPHKALSDAARAYLKSSERKPEVTTPSDQQAAA